ncbi:hypothetical protein [Methylomagnum sp.]
MLKHTLSRLAPLVLLAFAAPAAHAAPFSFVYNDTVSDPGTVPDILAGDAVKITITLDNGGSSASSQTWTSSDLTSLKFDFDNGTLVTTFTSPFDGGLDSGTGDFMTDGAGALTSIFTLWADSNITVNFATNDPNLTNGAWQLGGGSTDGAYFNDVSAIILSGQGSIASAGNWVLDAPGSGSPVPAPATPLLILAGLAAWRSAPSRRTA